MKFLPLASLALVASLTLSGCSSNKYSDLGYQLATAESSFSCIWADESRCKSFYEEAVDPENFCRQAFDEYLEVTNDKEFLTASPANVKLVIEGCVDAYPEGVKSRFP